MRQEKGYNFNGKMFSVYEFRISKKPIRFQILSSYPNTIRNRGLYFFQTLRELLELSLFQPKKEFGKYVPTENSMKL